jgi:PKD domain
VKNLKMRIVIGISLILVISMVSCNKPPEACITVDNKSAAAGTAVTFSSSCSKRALSYIWTIEGPVGAAENNIQFSEESFTRAFAVQGSYTITLDAYQKFSWGGQTASTTETVTVN